MGNESNDLIKRDIYKAHQAIAVAPSPGSRINLLTRRFFNVLLQHAQRQGNVETFRAPLSAILNDANYSSQNFEVAKAVLRGLAKTTVEWSVVNDESEKTNVGRRWGISSLLAQAELIDDGSSIHFEWSYAPAIRNSMLDPSRYVQLDMVVFASLRTGTAASLYEICTRYLTNFGGLTNKETWEWWRPRLTGVPDDGTPTEGGYKFFKRDRLMPAINEINELSNITVELHEFRTGRRITHIQFSSKEKSQASLGLESIENDGVVEKLCDIGFTEQAAARLYAANESDVLAATLAYVEMRMKKGGVESPVALFRDALRKGYGVEEGAKALAKAKTAGKKASSKTASTPSSQEQAVDPAEASKRAREYLDALPADDLKDVIRQFSGTLAEGSVVLGYFQRSGMKSKVVKTALEQFVASTILSKA